MSHTSQPTMPFDWDESLPVATDAPAVTTRQRRSLPIVGALIAAAGGIILGASGMALVTTGEDSVPPASVTEPSSMLDAAQTLSPQVLTGADGTVYLPVDLSDGWEYDGRTYYPVDPAAAQ